MMVSDQDSSAAGDGPDFMSFTAMNGATDIVQFIRDSVIGKDTVIATPFGSRQLVYADYTASGRMLSFLEDYMRFTVYPLYGNTHTEASATGLQSTVLREEARSIISESVNAPLDEYVTLFTGTGCTAAIDKLGTVLGLVLPRHSPTIISDSHRPVVFHGPYEHHSNELWWRESIATVVAIELDSTGQPDLDQLARELERYADRPLKLGSFSAGSNVTGMRANTTAIAQLLHAHGALAFFDFAAVGPYVHIDMRPAPTRAGADASMDAIFVSPHKFIGGPGSTGLLVARRRLFTNAVPTCPGGGTVSYASPHHVDYESSIEAREDAGTPGILQAIRTGLAFMVKEKVGSDVIELLEQKHGRVALEWWKEHPRIRLVGSDRSAYFDYGRRVSIISFNIVGPAHANFSDEYGAPQRSPLQACLPAGRDGPPLLHPHFVIQLLNDVYGIQGRSGCSCAGPFGHRVYGIHSIGNEAADAIRASSAKSMNAAKPGWARVNFNYFMSEQEVQFVCRAVCQIADDGWRLLPFYRMDPHSGQFEFRTHSRFKALRSLKEISLDQFGCRFRAPLQQSEDRDFEGVLHQAKQLYDHATEIVSTSIPSAFATAEDFKVSPSPELLQLLWWLMPSQAATLLRVGNHLESCRADTNFSATEVACQELQDFACIKSSRRGRKRRRCSASPDECVQVLRSRHCVPN